MLSAELFNAVLFAEIILRLIQAGNELEGLLVRAVRVHALQLPESPKKSFPEVLAEVARQFKPSAHTARLELMDLLAVKECTDACFLPERFASLGPEEVETGIRRLRGEG